MEGVSDESFEEIEAEAMTLHSVHEMPLGAVSRQKVRGELRGHV